jgi:hypothetical protein
MAATGRDALAQSSTADREIVISRVISGPTGGGVRGVHRSPAPVAMVGTGGVHHHSPSVGSGSS